MLEYNIIINKSFFLFLTHVFIKMSTSLKNYYLKKIDIFVCSILNEPFTISFLAVNILI